MLRALDFLLSALGLLVASPLLVILAMAGLFDTGSPLFRQMRVGRDEKLFTLIKIRTMKPETGSVGTHEVNPDQVTAWGRFLRTFKIDELPQLWNVLKGEMSFVGPRPCLPNQTELIAARKNFGIGEAGEALALALAAPKARGG